MAAPLAAAGAARAGALAWSERRWLLWVLVLRLRRCRWRWSR